MVFVVVLVVLVVVVVVAVAVIVYKVFGLQLSSPKKFFLNFFFSTIPNSLRKNAFTNAEKL